MTNNAYNDNYGAGFGAAQSTYSTTSPFAHTNMYGGGVLDYKQGVSFQAPPTGPVSVAAAPETDAFNSAPGGAVSVMPFHGGAEVTMKVVDVAPPARAAASAEATDSKEVARRVAQRFVLGAAPEAVEVAASSGEAVDRLCALENRVETMHAGLEHHTKVLSSHVRQMQKDKVQGEMVHEGLMNHTEALQSLKHRVQMQHDGLQNHTEVIGKQVKALAEHKATMAKSGKTINGDAIGKKINELSNTVARQGKEVSLQGSALKEHRVAIAKQHEGLLSHGRQIEAIVNNPYVVETGVSSTKADLKALHGDLKKHSTYITATPKSVSKLSKRDMRAMKELAANLPRKQ